MNVSNIYCCNSNVGDKSYLDLVFGFGDFDMLITGVCIDLPDDYFDRPEIIRAFISAISEPHIKNDLAISDYMRFVGVKTESKLNSHFSKVPVDPLY